MLETRVFRSFDLRSLGSSVVNKNAGARNPPRVMVSGDTCVEEPSVVTGPIPHGGFLRGRNPRPPARKDQGRVRHATTARSHPTDHADGGREGEAGAVGKEHGRGISGKPGTRDRVLLRLQPPLVAV
eukprot:scaffold1077_cov344-Pavlova_lutheri.AAC.7